MNLASKIEDLERRAKMLSAEPMKLVLVESEEEEKEQMSKHDPDSLIILRLY